MWWNKPQRFVQYNLQEKDTGLMDPEVIAAASERMNASGVVINVAGDVAYYNTEVPYHTVNQCLPRDRDLFGEIVDAHHARNMKVVGRLSCGLLTDEVYHQNPSWVMRKPDKTPVIMGEQRPGLWNLMYSYCVNSSYVEEVTIPAVLEVLERYPLDGVFLCGMFAAPCWCDACKEKYRNKYGRELPADPRQFEPGWLKSCEAEKLQLLRNTLKEHFPEVPFIAYYHPFKVEMGENQLIKTDAYSIKDCQQMGNLILEEAQDILTLGKRDIQCRILPLLRTKVGTCFNERRPVGLIHSAPGLEWRHVDVPEEEYIFWASQVILAGGQLWYSLTGFAEAMYDRRVIATVSELNKKAEKALQVMENSQSGGEVLILCAGERELRGWACSLAEAHIDFDLMPANEYDYETLEKYKLVIVPSCTGLNGYAVEKLIEYISKGGKVIVEGTNEFSLGAWKPLFGISHLIVESEEQQAAYLRIEDESAYIRQALGDTELIPLRGAVGFIKTVGEDVDTILSWVPPFAPAKYICFPPDRASLPTKRTRSPMVLRKNHGKGQVMMIACNISQIADQYGMKDHFDFIIATVKGMMGERAVDVEAPRQVISTVFKNDNGYVVHLLNGVGERPLREFVTCKDICVSIAQEADHKICGVRAELSGTELPYEVKNGRIYVELPELYDWEILHFRFQ